MGAESHPTHDFLKKVPIFAELTDDDLELVCNHVAEVHLAAGQQLFAEGDPGDRAYVIKEGKLEVHKGTASRQVLLAVLGPEEVVGEVALLEDQPRMASVKAREDSVLVVISKAQLENLIQNSATAASAMFYTMLRRWRNTEAMLRQNEKMAQLGTLTAGIAHELNNPSAAVRRAAKQMEQSLVRYGEAQVAISKLDLNEEQQQLLQGGLALAQEKARRPPIIDALTRSDREYEIESWLEDRGVEDAWELAPTLVNLEFDVYQLTELSQHVPNQFIRTVAGWLEATYSAYNLLAEMGLGSEQISNIVSAMKSYSYLDQAPVQDVDIHQGLDDTLLILRHKLKEGITVVREYAPEMPEIHGYGSELNQVWTNILDNAADALEGHGQITLRTRVDGDWAIVEIEDNGPGIPEKIQHRLFEPFFTTKPPGKGTGLGLDISYNIVSHKHHGDIKIFSKPGETRFEVWLPLTQPAA